MAVGSGSLFVTKIRMRSPSTASMVGPGLEPLNPHMFTFIPGANSRTTGSQTRWNSLTLLFMRQGSDHPLSVTTGWNGRPEAGGGGGCVAADEWSTASGKDAAATRLTAVAPSATAPAVLKKFRRFDMAFLLSALWRTLHWSKRRAVSTPTHREIRL